MKKVYVTPEVIVHGTVEQIPQGRGFGGFGGFGGGRYGGGGGGGGGRHGGSDGS